MGDEDLKEPKVMIKIAKLGPGIKKQEESARERALCQLTECF